MKDALGSLSSTMCANKVHGLIYQFTIFSPPYITHYKLTIQPHCIHFVIEIQQFVAGSYLSDIPSHLHTEKKRCVKKRATLVENDHGSEEAS